MYRWPKFLNYLLVLIIGLLIGWFGHSWKFQKEIEPEQITNVTVVARFSENNIAEYQNIAVAVGSSISDALKVLEQKQVSYKLEEKDGRLKLIQLMGVDGNWECEVDGQLNQIGLDKFRLRGNEKIIFKNNVGPSLTQ
jgi:hypothetical protein